MQKTKKVYKKVFKDEKVLAKLRECVESWKSAVKVERKWESALKLRGAKNWKWSESGVKF